MNRTTRKTRFAKTAKHNARVKLAAKRHAGRAAFLRDKADRADENTRVQVINASFTDHDAPFFDGELAAADKA